MKRKIYEMCLLSGCLLLWSCNQPDGEDSAGASSIPEEALIDTATASSAPVVEEMQDTTLQQVEEVVLRATGNTLEEIAYDQDTLEVGAGAHVKLTFINEGVDMPMVHNVVFTAPDTYKRVAIAGAKIGASGNYVPTDSAVIAASPMVLPGQTVEMEFTAPAAPGVYHFVCTYPEHWQRMHGVLLVK